MAKKAPQFDLWGWRTDGAYGPQAIKLTGGNLGQCRAARREREREATRYGLAPWLLDICAVGDAPTALRDRVAAHNA